METSYNSKQIELHNQNHIISCLNTGSVSRAEIAKRTGLSRTTVSSAVSHLIELQLLKECSSEDPSGRGRPGIPLSLTEDLWYAAGATLIDREVIFAVLNLRGDIVSHFSLPLINGSSQAFLSTLSDGFSAILRTYGSRLLPMLGIGSPGMINDGRILYASDMGWTQVDIAGYLQTQIGLPSEVINRHWASSLSEFRSNHVSNMIYVGISTGIAAAIIVNGKLFTGAYHSAGEIGHTVVRPNGPKCICGRRGCLHAIASEVSILEHVRAYYRSNPHPLVSSDFLWESLHAGRSITIDDVCQAAKANHPLALNELKEAALYLGLSISNLTGMFNPECVVLGGSFIEHGGTDFTNWIIDSVRMHSGADTLRSVRIYPWTQGRISGAVGAALQVLDRKIELAGRVHRAEKA